MFQHLMAWTLNAKILLFDNTVSPKKSLEFRLFFFQPITKFPFLELYWIKPISDMMLKVWKWYQTCLTVHPVKTQVISSGILWGLGDIGAQAITHSTKKKKLKTTDDDEPLKLSLQRAATASIFGFGFVGPVGHFWYEGLDRVIKSRLRPNSIGFVGSKVALDGFVFAPIYMLSYFVYMGFSTGKTVTQVKEAVKRDSVPALAVGAVFFPLLQVINFRFVPVRYQLMYVNMFALFDSAFMSWLEQQEDAPWKKWFTSFLALEEQQKKKS